MPYSPWCHHCPHCMECPKHGIKTGRNLSGKPKCIPCEEEAKVESASKLSRYQEEYRIRNRERLNAEARARNKNRDNEYWIWIGMNSRCQNASSENYSKYGAAGVTVCEAWRRIPGRTSKKENAAKYEQFRKDIGPRPSTAHTLDRYPDRNGNYEPGNVRWALPDEQANNRRNNVSFRNSISNDSPIHYGGRVMTLSEFSDLTGLHIAAVRHRYAIRHDADWILTHPDITKKAEYHGHLYKFTEIAEILNIPYHSVSYHIGRQGKSVYELENLTHIKQKFESPSTSD